MSPLGRVVLGLILVGAGVLMLVYRRRLYDFDSLVFGQSKRGGCMDIWRNVVSPLVLIALGGLVIIATLLGR
jgi:hypothetical protein